MSTEDAFTRFATLIDVAEASAQNVQELAAIWGQIAHELEEIGVTVEDAYAMLGEYDFLVIFEAPSTEDAFQADVVLERHGLAVQTTAITPTEQFAALVDDL